MNPTDLFIDKLNRILNILSSSEEGKDETRGNLLAALFMTLTEKIASNPKSKDFILELSKKTPNTPEEYQETFNFTSSKIKELGMDPAETINLAGKEILENFVKELEPKLPQEKIPEIKKIISE